MARNPLTLLPIPLLTLLGVLTCTTVEEPPCPQVEIPDNTGDCNTFCDCGDEVVGRIFRFTQLEIDEPDAFANMLNPIWGDDIINNTLNVLFEVKEVVTNDTGSFDEIRFYGGPGWRDPPLPLAMPPEVGTVDTYCMLDDYQVDVVVERYHGNQCEFKSSEMTTLFFHSGPASDPLVCAPVITPQNAIPITNLKIRFNLNRDCSGMSNGFLEGCITQEDSNKICMCMMGTGSCPLDGGFQDGSISADTLNEYIADREDPNLSKYCKDGCGGMWLSFGSSVSAFDLMPTCINHKGEEGYRIQGFISAEDVTDQFNPVPSDDCTEY